MITSKGMGEKLITVLAQTQPGGKKKKKLNRKKSLRLAAATE